jgi:hypothetical protein
MTDVNRWKLGIAAFIVAATLGACGAPEEMGDDLDDESGTIVNGHTATSAQVLHFGLVAVYHWDPDINNWFARPCSGHIIKSVSGVSWVLTARHCITTDGTIDGSLLTWSQLKFARTATPGPTPPASAVFADSTAGSIRAMPVVSGVADYTRDLALVRVVADWSTSVTSKLGLFVQPPANLQGFSINAFGYGATVPTTSCTDSTTTGTGTARWATFVVNGTSFVSPGGHYAHNNTNALGQKVTCGDSGGPDYAVFGSEDHTWGHIIGVHSRAGSSSSLNAVAGKWLHDNIGGLFVSSYWTRTMDLGWNGATSLRLHNLSSEEITSFKYDHATGYLTVNPTGQCLNSSLTLVSCSNVTSKRWTVSSQQRITSVQTGQCLTHSGTSSLALATCSSAGENDQRQRWAFHPQL